MHQKLQCLQPALVNSKGTILLRDNAWPHLTHPTLQKLNELGDKVCLIHHIHLISRQLITTSSSISTTFCRENTSTISRRQNAFQKLIKPLSMDFYTTGINLFLTGKNVLVVMVPIFINRHVFEPSYDDLNFMAQNHNYFCTHLITLLTTLLY